MGRTHEVWRRFRKHKLALVGLVIIGVYLLVAVFGPMLAPYEPYAQHPPDRLQGPSAKFWLGTDEYGRCIFTRIIYGTRVSIIIGFSSIMIGVLVGGTLGLVAAYYRSLDRFIMYWIDVLLAFPAILLAIGVMAILGPGLINVIIAVGIRQIPSFARMTRSTVMGVRDSEYTEAVRALGASDPRIIFGTILPNCLAPLLVYGTLQVGWAILLGAILSFVGIGVPPPLAEWGRMVSDGRRWLRQAPHIATFPGIAILLLVMSFNLVGDALRDSLDPRLKN